MVADADVFRHRWFAAMSVRDGWESAPNVRQTGNSMGLDRRSARQIASVILQVAQILFDRVPGRGRPSRRPSIIARRQIDRCRRSDDIDGQNSFRGRQKRKKNTTKRTNKICPAGREIHHLGSSPAGKGNIRKRNGVMDGACHG